MSASILCVSALSVYLLCSSFLLLVESDELRSASERFARLCSIASIFCAAVNIVLLALKSVWLRLQRSQLLGAAVLLSSVLSSILLVVATGLTDIPLTFKLSAGKWNKSSLSGVSSDVLVVMLLVPIVIPNVLKPNLILVRFCWLSVIITGIIIGYFSGSTDCMNATLLYTPLSLSFMLGPQNKSESDHSVNTSNRHFAIAKEDQIAELRCMIGNVAHDLKTPLSGLINGVEAVVECLLKDYSATATATAADGAFVPLSVQHAVSLLQELQHVHVFMLLTIHRYIDASKAFCAISLAPQCQPVDLLAVLMSALTCVNAVQDKAKIRLEVDKDSGIEAGMTVVTDAQWLHENTLCLLSNAAKYSTANDVRMKVSLLPDCTSLSSSRRKSMQEQRKLSDDEVSGPTPVFEAASKKTSRPQNSLRLLNLLMNHAQWHNRVNPADGEVSSSADRLISAARVGTLHTDFSVDVQSREVTAAKMHPSPRDSTADGGYVLIEVEDASMGIPPERLQSIFEPGPQAQRKSGGTGFGLFVLSRRVEALGGYYGAEERRDRSGSVFWMLLPTAAPMVSQDSPRPDRDQFVPLKSPRVPFLNAVPESTSTRMPSSGVLRRSGETSDENSCVNWLEKHLHILLVDDSPTIQRMTSHLLKRHGHDVDVAEDGSKALECLASVQYDVVFMDLQMPVMDGFEATRRIRANEAEQPSSRRQFVLALSANSDAQTIADAFAAGVDDFIAKPFTMGAFQVALGKHFAPAAATALSQFK